MWGNLENQSRRKRAADSPKLKSKKTTNFSHRMSLDDSNQRKEIPHYEELIHGKKIEKQDDEHTKNKEYRYCVSPLLTSKASSSGT